jgi:Heat induced stress protein YflT
MNMAGKNTVVYGIYKTRTGAEDAVDQLLAQGFRNEDISVLLQDNVGTKDFAHEKETKAPEGTTTGVVAGGAVGGTLGLLAGIGALAIPGVGPFIAAGPIMGALAGIGSGGIVGGIIGALVGMGIPEYEAKRYEGRIKEGGILLSVHCDNSEWVGRAKDLLKRTGADDVSSTGEASADFAKTDKPLSRGTSAY